MDNNKKSDNEKGLQQSRNRINADFLAEIKKAEAKKATAKKAEPKNNQATNSKQNSFWKKFFS